ncbi:amino acid transporter [Beijerinckiaceae bacterium]|nr:amino acid transporter [Beijerinckiaceae bacterium]
MQRRVCADCRLRPEVKNVKPSIGAIGALSIGIGGIVGGGFFATFGLTVEGAKGGTPIAFLLGGVIALLTAHSYIGLTLRYPGPGGTVAFIRIAFGQGLLAASVNILLILSYVAIMAVYAAALASYSVPYLPPDSRAFAAQMIASFAVLLFGLVNFAGATLMRRLETFFNVGKLGVLGLFVVAGLLVGHLEWSRLGPAEWAPASTIVASGMLGFLAFEGFELIANASDNVINPKRTLPIAFLGSVIVTIVIYVLAFFVAIGHLPFTAIVEAKSFAVSAAANNFLGPIGFSIMAAGAVLASASAINADYFGASKLPVDLSAYDELPSAFHRSLHGKAVLSLLVIGILAILAVNVLNLHALSAATSGGFLIVYAAVNVAAVKLAPHTGCSRLVPLVAALLCLTALAIMVLEFLSNPATVTSGIAVGGIIIVAALIEVFYRAIEARTQAKYKIYPLSLTE